jgi:drug/metabolite transporter (DMT)-like permease
MGRMLLFGPATPSHHPPFARPPTPARRARRPQKKAPEGWNPPPLEKAQFYKQMVFVGLLRFCTVMLGLLALHALAVSFTEVVKSSAPFVTVIFSRLIVGEKLTWLGYCSLLPVVLGLALSSYSEVGVGPGQACLHGVSHLINL